MPLKIKKLKAAMAKAGFVHRSGKGSHTVWAHPALSSFSLTISGKDGDDAEPYQIKDVKDALKMVGKTL
jgi:predicted RNA binding protein YcfA (HicA-like mRNA interferase family)